ncbi:DUF2325 domain-containing protein [Acetobacterium bakii]|uniref:DUF2325 domain-containing protein n=1 Tax=Acetobacterium bakii TaxID=52689 RepID=A0A0L6U4H7_9FIRM|nr:DUF2325 domain-containing protein [Acetobacterium bakii]KNZ43414.1 hypothetical protein AKG39_01575 [Acetobacterium bakii]
MSIVIIGGNDRMIYQYKGLCKEYGCRAKVFTQMQGAMKKKIGNPDLVVLFTNTVSHKMVTCAVSEAKKFNLPLTRCHTSSLSALRGILEEHSRCKNCNGCSGC